MSNGADIIATGEANPFPLTKPEARDTISAQREYVECLRHGVGFAQWGDAWIWHCAGVVQVQLRDGVICAKRVPDGKSWMDVARLMLSECRRD